MKKGCKYCTYKEDGETFYESCDKELFHLPITMFKKPIIDAEFYIEKAELRVRTDMFVGDNNYMTGESMKVIPIEFCPMCGRKLSDG